MLALQQDAPHQPAVARDIPMPQPAAGEILLKLHAAALNHRDVWIQKGQYAGIKLPCTLGADGAGEIAALGAGVEGWDVGAPVIVYPGVEWGTEERTRAYSPLGVTGGTFTSGASSGAGASPAASVSPASSLPAAPGLALAVGGGASGGCERSVS